ncbi:MAG: hypothetical protein OYL97_16145 [Candidatus Poribacteria bacterium]|nr:hypothetical protein [Candidatus Poribacteria bacterium]
MKNLRNQSIFTCLFLFVLISLNAAAVPPPSPAGGNYLALDGVNDHAILDFETFGFLMPKGTDEWTFEAWIYPTKLPDENLPIILSQQVRMYAWTPHQRGDFRLMGAVHLDRAIAHATVAFPMLTKVPPNQWYHIVLQAEGRERTLIVNDFVRISRGGTILTDDLSHAEYPQDFTIGGFGEEIRSRMHGGFWGHFSGYIDEVRISKVARYNTTKRRFTPRTKFRNDAKTVALWHFDEAKGTREFSDTSGNAYHLVGKNGAQTDGEFAAVEAEGKLATIWGRLKR